jgi:hypothetical protein
MVLKYLDPIRKMWFPVGSTPGVALSDAPACLGPGVAGNVANATFSVIGMATPTRDPDGLWNGLGVTVKRTGVYIITGSLTFQYAGGTGEGIFYVGPSSTGADSDGWAADSVTFKSGSWARCSIATTVYLTAGSTIYWGAYQSSGGTVAVYNIDMGVTLQVAGTPGPQGPASYGLDAPGAKVYRTSHLSVVDSTYTMVPFQAVERDSHGFWSAGAPTRLTIPPGHSGWYSVGFGVGISGAGEIQRFLVRPRVNGSGYISGSRFDHQHPGVNYYIQGGTVTPRWLNAGDYVELEVYQDNYDDNAAINIWGDSADAATALWLIRLTTGIQGPQGPQGLPGGATTLDELTDVATGGQSVGQYLGWNGTLWVPKPVPAARLHNGGGPVLMPGWNWVPLDTWSWNRQGGVEYYASYQMVLPESGVYSLTASVVIDGNAAAVTERHLAFTIGGSPMGPYQGGGNADAAGLNMSMGAAMVTYFNAGSVIGAQTYTSVPGGSLAVGQCHLSVVRVA